MLGTVVYCGQRKSSDGEQPPELSRKGTSLLRYCQYTVSHVLTQAVAPGHLLGKSTPGKREPQALKSHWTPFLRVGGVLVIHADNPPRAQAKSVNRKQRSGTASLPGAGLQVDAGTGLRPGPTPLHTKTLVLP